MEKKKNLTAKWSLNIPATWNPEVAEDFKIIANLVGIDPLYRETQFHYEQYFKDVEWTYRLKCLLSNFKVNVGGQKLKKKHGVLVSKEKINEQELVGSNVNKETISIAHKELTRVGDSEFKSVCPECRRGLLTVRRNNETLELESFDRCLLCGQKFKYLDIPFE